VFFDRVYDGDVNGKTSKNDTVDPSKNKITGEGFNRAPGVTELALYLERSWQIAH
jgi:hypothetical protein